MPAKITVCYSDRPAVEQNLADAMRYRLGRSRTCELRLNHPTVSREHAQVSQQNNCWHLQDQHSHNGVKVNGEIISDQLLVGDEIITLGEIDCLFETFEQQQLDHQQQHNQWRLNSAQKPTTQSSQWEQTLQQQLGSVISLTGTQRGLVLLGTEPSKLTVAAALGMKHGDFKQQSFEGSVGAILKALETQQAVISMDVSCHQYLAQRESIQLKKIAALAAVPLFSDQQILGIVYTDSHQSDKVLTELDMEILSQISQQIECSLQAMAVQQQIDRLQNQLPVSTNEHTPPPQPIVNQSFIQLIQ